MIKHKSFSGCLIYLISIKNSNRLTKVSKINIASGKIIIYFQEDLFYEWLRTLNFVILLNNTKVGFNQQKISCFWLIDKWMSFVIAMIIRSLRAACHQLATFPNREVTYFEIKDAESNWGKKSVVHHKFGKLRPTVTDFLLWRVIFFTLKTSIVSRVSVQMIRAPVMWLIESFYQC